MNLALVTDGISPFVMGGIQRHSRMLVETLARHGVDITLIHTAAPGSSAALACKLDGLPQGVRGRVTSVFIEPRRRLWFPGHYRFDCEAYSTLAFERLMAAARKPDFIYAQGLTGLAFVRARRRGDSVPPVGVNAHGYEMFQPCFGLKSHVDQWLIRGPHREVSLNADVVFSFSGKIREIVERRIGVAAERIIEIPNGVDDAWLRDTLAPPTKDVRFLFIGRHERRKGLRELLLALDVLPPEGWSLNVVGPIPQHHRVTHPRVRFTGPLADPQKIIDAYDAADCVICPSYAEGMPTVILEAMARGLATIATDVGAVAELVSDGCGILIAGPRPSLIADAMRRVCSMTPPEFEAMRHSALRKARGYAWQKLGKRIIESIERTVNRC